MKKILLITLLLLSVNSFAQVYGYSGLTFRGRDSSQLYQLQNYSSGTPNQGLPDWYHLRPIYKEEITSGLGTKALRYNPITNRVYYADTTTGGGGGVTVAVDTIYRTPGKDSIQFTINGRYHAILDSVGSGGGSGVTTVGTFSGSSQTNGASISGSTITFGPADGSNPGMVTTGTQTIAGAKTFSSNLTVNGNGTPKVILGDPGLGAGFAAIGVHGTLTTGNYTLMGNGSNAVYVNTPTGGAIYFRENNADTWTIHSGGNLTSGANFDASVRLWITASSGGTYPFIISANAAQTNPLFQIRTSGGTPTFTIESDSRITTTKRVLFNQGAAVASANNLSLGTDGNVFEITGTTQINLISKTNWQDGSEITLLFTSTPTVKNGQTTSGANTQILLAGAADFSATADDALKLVLSTVGGVQAWREVSRSVN